MRRVAVRSVVLAGLLVLAGGLPAGAHASAGAGDGPGAEADVAYHGRVSLTGARLRIWLVPENDGPAALANATVRVRLSAGLADGQELSRGCARAGLREVVCETGPLPLHGRGRHIGLALGLREPASEVVVRVDTWWNGGAADRNLANNEHVVLALDTGDAYAF
ncbi:hypothetical protein [Streptomyces sp. ISL-94]|uniref:hypothetical protein n=1 Tax=Streptomyces sp. ISL-94 TaxID=2819190 RepID=UPI001BEA975C|nr:hypothetical protein [Streptomyces sp. ISL-94]MBT2476720.1 hypothetical protein [Streptomyces sp. ISL-94]